MRRDDASNQVQRSVQASEEEIRAILDRLDAASPHPRSSMRERERFPYRVHSCTVKLQQPGAPTTSPFLAPTRNLSAGGMSFLHGGFVHAGVRCLAQLVTTDGRWIEVTGTVVRCRYVENWIHEVNVHFDAEIRPSDFCKAALRMRVLILEPDSAAAGLLAHHLPPLHCEVDRVEAGDDAGQKIADVHYNVVFVDTDSPDLDAPALIRGMGEQGYTGLVVAMTSSPTPEHRERCLLDGCADYLVKPATPDRLRPLLERLRQDPPTSGLLEDEATADVVTRFLAGLPERVRTLEEAADGARLDQLGDTVRQLGEDAGGFGFAPLADAAAALQSLVDGGNAPAATMRKQVEDLIGLCMLTRRAAPKDPGPGDDDA